MNTYTWSRLQSYIVNRPEELMLMSALNCTLLYSLVALKFASTPLSNSDFVDHEFYSITSTCMELLFVFIFGYVFVCFFGWGG